MINSAVNASHPFEGYGFERRICRVFNYFWGVALNMPFQLSSPFEQNRAVPAFWRRISLELQSGPSNTLKSKFRIFCLTSLQKWNSLQTLLGICCPIAMAGQLKWQLRRRPDATASRLMSARFAEKRQQKWGWEKMLCWLWRKPQYASTIWRRPDNYGGYCLVHVSTIVRNTSYLFNNSIVGCLREIPLDVIDLWVII